MAIGRPWKALNLHGDFPLVFLKAKLDSNIASFELTDLNRIWGVDLSRSQLIKSTIDQGCSIDPGEDDEQYDQFLAKVGSALARDEQTTLTLEPEGQDGIRLNVTALLPGSLPRLKWAVELLPLHGDDSRAMESDILTPLLLLANSLKLQVKSLVEELRHKDRVIAKITDKLETSGNDLTQVFPGVSNIRVNRKSSQRAQLARHIRGLADFDEASWKAQAVNEINDDNLSVHDVNIIFADMPQPNQLQVQTAATAAWWRCAGNISVNREDDHESTMRSDADKSTLKLSTEESMQDDGFETQEVRPAQHNAEDDTTEDEEDLDAPSQRISQQNSASTRTLSHGRDEFDSRQAERHLPKNEPSQQRKLGDTGGKKTKAPMPETDPETESDPEEPPPRPKAQKSLGKFGGVNMESNSGVESDFTHISPPKPKSKLGGFGGKSNANTSTDQEMNHHGLEEIKLKSKLGSFGGKTKKTSDPLLEADADGIDAETSSKPAGAREQTIVQDSVSAMAATEEQGTKETEYEREDSVEQANKQRDKLKRELEEKSKAGVKKKRKF